MKKQYLDHFAFFSSFFLRQPRPKKRKIGHGPSLCRGQGQRRPSCSCCSCRRKGFNSLVGNGPRGPRLASRRRGRLGLLPRDGGERRGTGGRLSSSFGLTFPFLFLLLLLLLRFSFRCFCCWCCCCVLRGGRGGLPGVYRRGERERERGTSGFPFFPSLPRKTAAGVTPLRFFFTSSPPSKETPKKNSRHSFSSSTSSATSRRTTTGPTSCAC